MTSATTIPTAGTDTTWQIDPAHSTVGFSVRHLMISTVRGRFGTIAGSAKGLGGQGTPELTVTIDAASIDTGIAQRDEHLRSADFFDVAQFPTLTFRATRVDGAVDGAFTLVGDLTIRGVTREVALAVESLGQTLDPWGNVRAGFNATGKLSRSDFGLSWNQVLETGGLVVGDEVKLSVDVALTHPV